MDKMLTQYTYYQKMQEKRPQHVIVMRDFGSYYILGEKAKDVLPTIEKLLTHPDAGKCFSWSPSEFAYSSLSFGKHNLDRVLPALIRAGFSPAIESYDEYRKTPEYKQHEEQVFAHWRKMKEDEERKQKQRNPVQLELFAEFCN